jgi:hypothetical protein
MKRREFLRESAGVAALPLLGGVRPPSHDRATPEQRYRWATEHLQAGRCYRRAAELLEQAVAARPEEPRYREALACAYFDRALEISTWRRRQDLGSIEPPPASQAGAPAPQPEALEAEARKAVRNALAEVREAIRLARDNAEIHHTQGWILTLALQAPDLLQVPDLKAEDGLAAFETAVRLAPQEARYHRSLGDVLFTRTPLRDGFEMPAPAPGGPPPRISPEVFRRLMPGPTADQLSRWSAGRRRMLEAYRQAVRLRPAEGFLHYTLYGLYAAFRPEQRTRAWAHLEAARRLLPANATLSYDLALLRYRAAAEPGSKVILREQVEAAMAGLPPREREVLTLRFGREDKLPRTLQDVSRSLRISREEITALEAQIPRLSARQALHEASRIETMSPVWAAPEYPALLAAESRRLPLQDFRAKSELHGRLRALARDAVADAEELRKAGELRGAARLLDDALRLGERLIGDPQAVGPPENDGVIEKLVGIAIARIALTPLKGVVQELKDEDGARRVEAREAAIRTAHLTAHARVRAGHEARGGNWEEDVRAARAGVDARIRAIQEEGAEPDDKV